MKNILRKLFSPLLNLFESGSEDFAYKPLNRKILLAVGTLFLILVCVILFFGPLAGGYGYLLPASIFALASLTCLVVGSLGNDRAVAKIWGSR